MTRQVLAEPDATLAARSWASLADGTPLVTGERRGKGIVTLFHISADMRWSDLPMSGTFVEMLRRLVDISGTPRRREPAPPPRPKRYRCAAAQPRRLRRARPPPATAKPIAANFNDRATLDHPPGFYGPADGPLAVNTLAAADRLKALDTSGLRAQHAAYTNTEPSDLRGLLLAAALALFLIDAVIVALIGGGLAALLRRRGAVATTLIVALALGAVVAMPTPARAQTKTAPTISRSGRCRRPPRLRRSPATRMSMPSSRPGWRR